MLRKLIYATTLCATSAIAFVVPAQAQEFPDRPVELIVPFGTGGPTDLVARLLAKHWTDELGQQVVVANHPGGDTIVASQAVASSEPDGYTLLLGTLTLATNEHIYSDLPYNALEDFTAIGQVAESPSVLVVNSKNVAARSLEELLAAMEQAQMTYATAGTGTTTNLLPLAMRFETGAQMLGIPYQSGGAALTSVVSGETDFVLISLPASRPYIENGDVIPLAVPGSERLDAIPDVPTFEEAGVSSAALSRLAAFGVVGPDGIADDVVNSLSTSLMVVTSSDEFADEMEKLGFIVRSSTAAEFADTIAHQIEVWGPIIKNSDI